MQAQYSIMFTTLIFRCTITTNYYLFKKKIKIICPKNCYVIALNPDLLYCIFEFLICLPSRKERGLQGIFPAVVIQLETCYKSLEFCTCSNLHIIKFVSFLMRDAWRRQTLQFLTVMASVLQIILLFYDLRVRPLKWRYLCLVRFVNVHFGLS